MGGKSIESRQAFWQRDGGAIGATESLGDCRYRGHRSLGDFRCWLAGSLGDFRFGIGQGRAKKGPGRAGWVGGGVFI